MITLPFDARRVGQAPPVSDGDGLFPHVERRVVVLEQPPGVVLVPGHLYQDIQPNISNLQWLSIFRQRSAFKNQM